MAIGKIELNGTINARNTAQLMELFRKAENSNGIKAVLLVVNSGGGDASMSEKLHEGIKKLRAKKPVFAVIEGMGASGAYWMVSPANKIYALRTSIVGSIGVIGFNPNVTGLLEKLGLKIELLKVGEYKDMINPLGETTEEGRKKYMEILDNSYSVFKMSVSENRKLDPGNLEEASNGQLFTSVRAQEIGLIDKIGTFDDALEDLAKTYQLRPKVKILEPHRFLFERMFMPSTLQAIIVRILGL